MLTAVLLAGNSSMAAAELGTVHGAEAAEEDDFLVVKRRDIYDAAPPEPAAAAPGTGPHCLQPFIALQWSQIPQVSALWVVGKQRCSSEAPQSVDCPTTCQSAVWSSSAWKNMPYTAISVWKAFKPCSLLNW